MLGQVISYGYLHSAAYMRLFREKKSVQNFRLRKDAGDIPYSITLRSAGEVLFQSAGPTTAKARFWDREVAYGTEVQEDHSDQQSAAEEKLADICLYT